VAKKLWLSALLLLTACNNPTPTPMAQPTAGWAITHWGQNGMVQYNLIPLAAPSFALPQCASAMTCWVSYVEMHTGIALMGSSLKLSYTITGNSPTFVNDRPNNTCDPVQNPPALSLLIHRADDLGHSPQYDSYRWFVKSSFRVPLALGDFSSEVPLTVDKWINVMGQSTDAAGFAAALVNSGSVGLGLGGGCFAAHGIAVSQGNATLTVNSFTKQ
jgi:hypothetical protein